MAAPSICRLLPRLVHLGHRLLPVTRSCSTQYGNLHNLAFMPTQALIGRPAVVAGYPSLPQVRAASSIPQLSEDDVRKRIFTVCKNFDKITAEKLQMGSNFMSDLGLDSLDHVELIMAVEDEFGFEISDTDAEKLVTPAEIVKYVVFRQSPKAE